MSVNEEKKLRTTLFFPMPSRPSPPVVANTSVTAQLSARLSSLESQAWRLREAEDRLLAMAVPAVTQEVKSLGERLQAEQHTQFSQLEKKTEQFAHRVRVALHGMAVEHTKEAHALSSAASADAKANAHTLRDLQDRLARCESRLIAVTQEHAKLSVSVRGRSKESVDTDGAHSDVAGHGVGNASSRPAAAAAESAAAEASRAFACAEVAELAASEAKRGVEMHIAKQQKALEESLERERRMSARIDALAQALEEQSVASTATMTALSQRVAELEDGARATKLALRNLQISSSQKHE